MTSHRIKGEFAWSCDGCTESITPTQQTDFGAAWEEARGLGWRAIKHGWGDYEHRCPECARREGASE